MKVRFAQYGVAHAHAAGKAGVLELDHELIVQETVLRAAGVLD